MKMRDGKNALGASDFLGGNFSPGVDRNSGTSGKLESAAHTGIHIWLGNPSSCMPKDNGKEVCELDMGFLGTASRDPVFYSHHANADRLWHIWSTRLEGRNFEDQEWLNTSFTFYDKDKSLVRVTVRDFLDPAKLGYRYEDDEEKKQPWEDSAPDLSSDSKTKATSTGAGTINNYFISGSFPKMKYNLFPLRLTQGQNVELPSVARPKPTTPKQQQVLVFDAVEFSPREEAKFDVVINVAPEQAGNLGPRYKEYAGSFASLPRGGGKNTLVVPVELPLDDVLNDIGAANDGAVNVVNVPRTQGITIVTKPRIESKAAY